MRETVWRFALIQQKKERDFTVHSVETAVAENRTSPIIYITITGINA